jgi:hypothetical protein
MSSEALFPSRLGLAFMQLDPQLQWVHSGASRDLSGTVTVERGTSIVAKLLGGLTSLPPPLEDAPITVRIDIAGDKERWIRTYAGSHVMSSTLYKAGGVALVERVGPAALTFRVVGRDAGMDWQLEKVSMLGIPLPASGFKFSPAPTALLGAGPLMGLRDRQPPLATVCFAAATSPKRATRSIQLLGRITVLHIAAT